jgi:hypothetical protein
MSIELLSMGKTETAYDKRISFNYEGKEYLVDLHWDTHDGYDLSFTDTSGGYRSMPEPEWATNWTNEIGESLAYALDELSDEMLESSYL